MKIRGTVRGFFKWSVGDGSKIHIYDNWHPQGVLSFKFDVRAIFAASSYPSAKVSSVLANGQWQWRSPRSLDQKHLHQDCQLVQLYGEETLVWTPATNGLQNCLGGY